MDECQRKLLQKHRVELVTKLRPEPLYDFLVAKGIFTEDMIEEVEKSGTRRDQARRLVIDLQTRGRRAFPAFLESLEETGQHELVGLLKEGLSIQTSSSTSVNPVQPWKGYKPVQQETWTPHPVQCSDTDLFVPKKITTEERQDDMIYKMVADPCGCCLIINNVDFYSSSDLRCREGSDIDCEKVQKLFQKLHFEVIVKNNLTKQMMETELESLAGKDHSNFDCCVVVILSHGSLFSHSVPGEPDWETFALCDDNDCAKCTFDTTVYDVLPMGGFYKQVCAQPLSSYTGIFELENGIFSHFMHLLEASSSARSGTAWAQHREFPGAVYGVDGGPTVSVQRIVSFFDGLHSPTLREKPKLFFIQACGGDQKDTGFETAEEVDSAPDIPYDTISLQTDATPRRAEDEPDAVSSLPTPSDILVSYSTFPGYVSWRDKNAGSWYMNALVQVFSEYAHSDDLVTLLTRVTKSISENEKAQGKYKQIPGSFNFLRKRLYFFKKK